MADRVVQHRAGVLDEPFHVDMSGRVADSASVNRVDRGRGEAHVAALADLMPQVSASCRSPRLGNGTARGPSTLMLERTHCGAHCATVLYLSHCRGSTRTVRSSDEALWSTSLAAGSASLALLLATALPAAAAVDRDGAYGACGGTRVPAAQSLSYGEIKLMPPGRGYYYVWWDDVRTTHARQGVYNGGYWRAVVHRGALNDWGTYAYCSQ